MAQKMIDRHPWILLFVGALLLSGAQMRWGIAFFAFLAPVFLLRYLRTTQGWRSRLAFMFVIFGAWTATVAKIVTDSIPLAMAPGFALPIVFFQGLPYLAWGGLVRRIEGWKTVVAFVALLTLGEWVQHVFTPFASWGAAAYTQVENLHLVQIASVTGMAGVSALVYLVAATLEYAWAHGFAASRRLVATTAFVTASLLSFGSLRLALATDEGEETVVVAAVGTDSTIGTSADVPTAQEVASLDRGLFARTRRAAAAGARLVVWNEAATLVRPADEQRWLEDVRGLARQEGILLVAAYVLLLDEAPIHYENKYVMFRPDGTLDHTYLKHNPVPGEPAVVGTGDMPVVNAGFGRLSGAICYDYDFPRLALQQATDRVDMVALPSSDWRGIDPIHTQMASVRAVEGGHSVVRSARFGLSAGIDPYGRFRGWSSHFDSEERVLVVRLPLSGVQTVYSLLGDWFPAACGLLLWWIACGLIVPKAWFPTLRGGTVATDEWDGSLGNDSGLDGRLRAAGTGHGLVHGGGGPLSRRGL
jgi:apolipoprotein N-acyltransferase